MSAVRPQCSVVPRHQQRERPSPQTEMVVLPWVFINPAFAFAALHWTTTGVAPRVSTVAAALGSRHCTVHTKTTHETTGGVAVDL
jgi:hypothetical protein